MRRCKKAYQDTDWGDGSTHTKISHPWIPVRGTALLIPEIALSRANNPAWRSTGGIITGLTCAGSERLRASQFKRQVHGHRPMGFVELIR